MASGKAPHLERAFLDYVIHNVPMPVIPDTLYLAASTSMYDPAILQAVPAQPPSAAGYAQLPIAKLTTFASATGANPASISNVEVVAWPAATGNWGSIRSVYLLDALDGQVQFGGDLLSARAIVSGDVLRFAAGQLVLQEH